MANSVAVLFKLFICVCVSRSCICRIVDIHAEVMNLLRKEGIEDPYSTEIRLAKRIVYANYELIDVEKERDFHARISAAVLNREVMVIYNKRFLGSWFTQKNLDTKKNIAEAYRKFFDPKYPGKPNYVVSESNRLRGFLKREEMSVNQFIKKQSNAYDILSKFIHDYFWYCKDEIGSDKCSLLMYMAPGVDDFKSVLKYLQERIRDHLF